LVYGAPQDNGQYINGCSTAAILPSDSFEIYGTNHFFCDNGVYGQNGAIRNGTGVCMYGNGAGNITAPNSTNVTYPTNYNSCS